MLTLPANAALIVIDVQQGFKDARWGQRNNPQAEGRVATLLAAWRAAGAPLFHVRHASPGPDGAFRADGPGFAFQPEALPLDGEPVVTKQVNSGFIGTDLERRLRAAGVDTVVLCGLTTDHCVSTTARMAANLGFTAYVAADATATHARTGPDGQRFSAEQMHTTALASLHQEFARVLDSAALVAALARTARCATVQQPARPAACSPNRPR